MIELAPSFEIVSFKSKYMFFNSFGAKFSGDICRLHFYFNILSFGKTFIYKAERLNVKQRRFR